VPTTISPTSGLFVVGYLSAVRFGLFTRFRPFPTILSVLLQGLFRVGAGAFVGYFAVEPEFRNEYSLGYLVSMDDFYIAADISIHPNLL